MSNVIVNEVLAHNVAVWSVRMGIDTIDLTRPVVQKFIGESVWKETSREMALFLVLAKFVRVELGVDGKHAAQTGMMAAKVAIQAIYDKCPAPLGELFDVQYRHVDLDLMSAARQAAAVAIAAYLKVYPAPAGTPAFDISKFTVTGTNSKELGMASHPVMDLVIGNKLRYVPGKQSNFNEVMYLFVKGGHGVVTYMDDMSGGSLQYHDMSHEEFKAVAKANGTLDKGREVVDVRPENKCIGDDVLDLLMCELNLHTA